MNLSSLILRSKLLYYRVFLNSSENFKNLIKFLLCFSNSSLLISISLNFKFFLKLFILIRFFLSHALLNNFMILLKKENKKRVREKRKNVIHHSLLSESWLPCKTTFSARVFTWRENQISSADNIRTVIRLYYYIFNYLLPTG